VKVPAGTDDTASAAAIRREGRALARVRHDHVITLFDVVRAEGVDALVLELLTGPTLKVLVGQGRLAVDEVAALGLQLARGLCALHDAGVVHGDIKPSNLALTDGGLLKIFDLGVSRPSAGVWRSRAPAAGTPSYMPPERMRGDAGDVRSDIWSAGAVLFELATGRRAVDSLSSASRAALVRGGALPGVESLIRLLPQPLAPVVARAMDPLPRRRYQTAEQLDEALGQFARHRVSEPVRFRRLAGTASQAATIALVSFAV
jgi:serine/threonine protein kinase